jgi:hypothetical protein
MHSTFFILIKNAECVFVDYTKYNTRVCFNIKRDNSKDD